MDKSSVKQGDGAFDSKAQLPPWRVPNHSSQWRPSKRQGPPRTTHHQVDSWRSYKNDATNLQSHTSAESTLNAGAASFSPSFAPSQSQHFAAYQPLRVSNGSAECATLEAANTKPKTTKKHKNSLRRRMAQIDLDSQTPVPREYGSARNEAQPSQSTSVSDSSTGFPNRYLLRSTSGQATKADIPLPSIEAPEVQSSSNSVPKLPARPPSRTKSPEAPLVTRQYRLEAAKPPATLPAHRKLLVVLDLNGTLLYRSKNPGSVKKAHLRPGVVPLLDYLFANHVVMVYTSAMPQSAQDMLGQILHPKYRSRLAAVWARDKLGLTAAQYRNKVQVYKKLDVIWNDISIQGTAQKGTRWDQSNTVLIDDSHLKATAQPHNLVQVPEYTSADRPSGDLLTQKRLSEIQQDILVKLQRQLEELKYQVDVSRLIKKWQDGGIETPQVNGINPIVEDTVLQKGKEAANQRPVFTRGAEHLLTPESSREGEETDEPSLNAKDENDASYSPPSPVSSIGESVFQELLNGKDQ